MTDQSKRNSARYGWLAGVAGAGVLAFSVLNLSSGLTAQPAAPRTPAVAAVSFADVIDSVSPAVVNIAVMKVESAPTSFQYGGGQPGMRGGEQSLPFEFFERFFDGNPGGIDPRGQQERRSECQGSGFLIDASGYIVTNNHVAGGADEITVTMQDGHKYEAKLVGNDPRTDLALIKIDATGLPYVAFGDSDKARVGDWVVAIGNPFGLGGTATAGIISARGRDIRLDEYNDNDYLQLDAPINFGNSGGPVFNVSGQVVGVNTAIFSPNGGNVGIGFAIPANQAKEIIADLRDNGSVERGWLGVQIQDIDEDLAKSLHMNGTEGALVVEVVGDSPASKGGLQAGDVVTRFNDRAIDKSRTLSRAVAGTTPNSDAKVTVWRDGKSHNLTVEIGEAANEAVAAAGKGGATQGGHLGLQLRPLGEGERGMLGLPSDVSGAVVANVEPGSPAAEKGIRPGDVITRVNQKAVSSVGDAVAALNSAREAKETALLLVRRGDAQRFVALSFS
jgi:serine protease Do